MPHNDPDNLTLNCAGDVVLTCDWCDEEFTRPLKDARRQLRSNKGGMVYCGGACVARAANKARQRRHHGPGHVCHIRPGEEVCPLIAAPPLQAADLRRPGFKPQSETELDLCIEFVRASLDLKKHAPPGDHEDLEWSDTDRIAWERAEAVYSAVSRLLEREVSRRTR